MPLIRALMYFANALLNATNSASVDLIAIPPLSPLTPINTGANVIDCFSPRPIGCGSTSSDGSMRFYYDTRTNICQPFLYVSGCEDDDDGANLFDTMAKCMKTCGEAYKRANNQHR
jgi:hypothetical protein